ncbi:MAG TPA: TIGR04255 family protein [Fimbriiglobus sp.]|jgi:uncharacterized protein (TIGR04255 family)
MSQRAPTPKFAKPPLVETVLGVQFEALAGFRSHHYGWLWREFIGHDQWTPIADEKPLQEYIEPFGQPLLKTVKPPTDNALRVRLKLRNFDRSQTIQVQPDKFYFSWTRPDGTVGDYETIKPEFGRLYGLFEQFAERAGLAPVSPNLWEVMYVNQIPKGVLWDEPKDWHQVLPSLFPVKAPTSTGLKFATFDGEWHFEIEPRRGRVHVRVAKMIMNRKVEPVLFIQSIARGQIDETTSWSEGIDLGHDSCVNLFSDITSKAAHDLWERIS